ncbi:MAG: glycosyltransferase family 2 protein [Nanoarchaeota archaeon]
MNRIWIVVPAFNEEKNISSTIQDLKKHGYKNIVVVDDESRDHTVEKAKKAGVIVLQHIINRGQGAALRTGIEYALDQNADIVVTFDADGQFLASDLKGLIQAVEKKEYDISLGSRYLGKKMEIKIKNPLNHLVFAIRQVFLKGGRVFNYIFTRTWFSDSQSGLRAMNRHAAKAIEITQDRMAHATEILEQIAKKKLRFIELPITVRYTDETIEKGQGGKGLLAGFRIAKQYVFRKVVS